MIVVKNSKTKLTVKSEWADFTLKEAFELQKAVLQLPQKLRLFYKDTLQNKPSDVEFNNLDNLNILPKHYNSILTLFGIDTVALGLTSAEQITQLYNKFALKMVLEILFMPNVDLPKKGDFFTHEGVDYYYPESRTLAIGNQSIDEPFTKGTAIEFSELSDLQRGAMQDNGLPYFANIVAILCRPKGEEYDEQTCLNRVEGFMRLPMSIVWRVFFYLIKYLITQRELHLIYLKVMAIKADTVQQRITAFTVS